MRNWIEKMKANPGLWKSLLILTLIAAAGGGGFWCGRKQGEAKNSSGKAIDPDNLDLISGSGRIVAEIYNRPIYREEFGDYLIKRFGGKDRLGFMVNRKIVEMECQKRGIYATDGEVEARLQQDLWAYGGGTTPLSVKDFETKVLRNFGKSLYEWKEDVIRPKIMMEKLARITVKVTEEDLQKGFEARFGPKVECRMIVLAGDKGVAQKVWENARKGRNQFLEEARKQYIPQLAAVEGKVPPIHKHLGDKILEDTAFRLKDGEISGLLDMQDKTCVILMREKGLPADDKVKMSDVRQKLHQQIAEAKIAQALPSLFDSMKVQANPKVYLDVLSSSSAPIRQASMSKDVEPRVVVPPAPQPQPVVAPGGNANQVPQTLPPLKDVPTKPVQKK